MGPRGFWIALAIVLLYLIARPRIGTVWYVTIPPDQPVPSGATLIKSPPAGFVPDTPLPKAFAAQRDCWFAVGDFRRESGRTDAYCDSRYSLLWGW